MGNSRRRRKDTQKPSLSGGGAATNAGIEFQNGVAAWLAVRILAERLAEPPWGLPATAILTSVSCEKREPTDDILVSTSSGGLVFIQAKHTTNLSRKDGSAFGHAIDGFVRQFLRGRGSRDTSEGQSSRLDPLHDRLVLVVGPGSPSTIREVVPDTLARVRQRGELNKRQSDVLQAVERRVTGAWVSSTGCKPTYSDMRDFLGLVEVTTLDVDEGGSAEREAKDLLRMVLVDPGQANAAWAVLIRTCANLSAARGTLERDELRHALIKAGIVVGPPDSYREDIDRLRERSRWTIEALSDSSRLRVGGSEIRVARHCVALLRQAAEEGSVVVVGEAGTGKSGVMHDLAEILRNEGRDVVFFAVDRVNADDPGALRASLGLGHDLASVLENWSGSGPAFLLVDALDAARSERAARVLRDLSVQAARAGGRWRVVSSVRKHDLRYDYELQRTFQGSPPAADYTVEEFSRLRHFHIGDFDDQEIQQIAASAPKLSELLCAAEPPLKDLLRNPFNMRLAGDLIGEGMEPAELLSVETPLQLLDRYWLCRVIRNDRQRDVREFVLRRVVGQMLDRRSLRVPRGPVVDERSSSVLSELLSSGVLREWSHEQAPADGSVLCFSHNLLFDYAAERLLLRGDPNSVVDLLSSNPDLALMIRPSLMLHFRHLWASDQSRQAFWMCLFKIVETKEIPQIAKVVGPVIATELAGNLNDFRAVLHAVGGVGPHQGSGVFVLQHMFGSVLSLSTEDPLRALGQARADLWCRLVDSVSRSLSLAIVYATASLLNAFCQRPGALTTEQRASLGCAARRLLGFAWAQEPRDRWLVIRGIQGVCRTYESNPEASEELLRQCIDRSHLVEYGYQELPWLAREVERLTDLAPAFVRDVYCSAFAYRETRDITTPMGGRIISLISNASQDYRSALYQLSKVYPRFLESAPMEAIDALNEVIEAHVASLPLFEDVVEEEFAFAGIIAKIRTDYSEVWDSRGARVNDDLPQMLDAFEDYVLQLARDPARGVLCSQVVDYLAKRNRLAVLWRRLLVCGAAEPAGLGLRIRWLAWATPILTCSATTTEAGNFLKAIQSRLSRQERVLMEQAILSIPSLAPQDRVATGERFRNRLLGCLAPEYLATDEAGALVAELQRSGGPPPNEPLTQIGEWTGSEYGEREYLKEKGVPVDDSPNRRIQELEIPVQAFTKKHLNASPTIQQIEEVYPALFSLKTAVDSAEADGVHPRQRDYAWGYLAEACYCAAKCRDLCCQTQIGEFVKATLLEAARHSDPPYLPEYDAQFDETPGWSFPSVRVSAAAGLATLTKRHDYLDPDLIDALRALMTDPVRAVRYQVAVRLAMLHDHAVDLMWEALEYYSKSEESCGVLHAVVVALEALAPVYSDRVAALTKRILERAVAGPGSDKVREACISVLTGLYVWKDHRESRDVVYGVVGNPTDFSEENQRVTVDLADALVTGPPDQPDQKADAVRARAWDLLLRVVNNARRDIEAIQKAYGAGATWSEEDSEKTRRLLFLLDSVSTVVYRASGASEQEHSQGGFGDAVSRGRERFYREASCVLEELGRAGIPAVTHTLLETLEYLAPVDPADVFMRMSRTLRWGQEAGYQHESLAIELFVRMVNRYLAEFPWIFQESGCRKALLDALDVFVEAGWPSARNLLYGIEEVFR